MHWGLEPCSSIKQGHEYKKKKEVDESSQQNSKLKKSKKKKMYRSEQKTKTGALTVSTVTGIMTPPNNW